MNQTTTPSDKETAGSKRAILRGVTPAHCAALLAGLTLALIAGVPQLAILTGSYGLFPAVAGGFIYLAAAAVTAAVFTALLQAVKMLRWQTVFVLLFAAVFCVATLFLEIYLLPFFASAMAAVYTAVMFATGKYGSVGKIKRLVRYILMGLSCVVFLIFAALLLWPGSGMADRPEGAVLAMPHADRLTRGEVSLPNPSTPGSYGFSEIFYAADSQKIAPYPGQQTILSKSVDGSELVEGWSGIRTSMLGFGAEAMPLNGQVWMPEGDGPFPLTLIVHGGHDSGDRSDGGYAYLGELLASRGIIAVSVDENFLNQSLIYDLFVFASLQEENDARAFVLLEHLNQWYDWNEDAASPFYGKVDFDNIALIGHSRGGEAVAAAAAFANLGVYPDDGSLRFDYPFTIKSVAAIAPIDNQYDPAGLTKKLENINYLVIHGEHDMDVYSFQGANMYSGTDVTEGGMKARIWMQYANHGQFNSSWGADDALGLFNMAFTRKQLMPMEEQQQAAKAFIGAFLESTLNGKEEYNVFFEDLRVGEDWLPASRYIYDYADSTILMLDGFDSDFNIASNPSGQALYSAQGFEKWTEGALPGKWDNTNRVLTLEWEADSAPVFTAEFSDGAVSAGDKIYASLCSGSGADEPGVSFVIRLTDSMGNTREMSVDDFGGVVNQIDAPIAKPIVSGLTGAGEPVLQMVCIPTDEFEGLNGSIIRMDWVFESGESGAGERILYADDLRVGK